MYPVMRNEPPGAVGGRYGSGCFHFSSKFSVSLINSWLQLSAELSSASLHAGARHRDGCRCKRGTHPLLPRLGDALVRLKKSTNIQGLSTPEVTVDAPVECELQGPPVKASAVLSVSARSERGGGFGEQDLDFGAHSDNDTPIRVRCGREDCVLRPQCLVVVADV